MDTILYVMGIILLIWQIYEAISKKEKEKEYSKNSKVFGEYICNGGEKRINAFYDRIKNLNSSNVSPEFILDIIKQGKLGKLVEILPLELKKSGYENNDSYKYSLILKMYLDAIQDSIKNFQRIGENPNNFWSKPEPALSSDVYPNSEFRNYLKENPETQNELAERLKSYNIPIDISKQAISEYIDKGNNAFIDSLWGSFSSTSDKPEKETILSIHLANTDLEKLAHIAMLEKQIGKSVFPLSDRI